MQKKKLPSLLPIVLLAFSSCITASINSTKSPEFHQDIKTIFITLKGAPESKHFFHAFKNELHNSFNARNIKCEFHTFDELSLETEEDVMHKIASFSPQVLMVVNQTERRSVRGGLNSSPGATFDVKIFQPNSKKLAWRASLETDTFSELSEGAHIAAKRLINQLVLDGMIASLE
jgi:hypothetical protein